MGFDLTRAERCGPEGTPSVIFTFYRAKEKHHKPPGLQTVCAPTTALTGGRVRQQRGEPGYPRRIAFPGSFHPLQTVGEVREQLLLARDNIGQFIDAGLDLRVIHEIQKRLVAGHEQKRVLRHHIRD